MSRTGIGATIPGSSDRPLFELEHRGFAPQSYSSACWIWKRAVSNGYARAGINYKLVYVHRHYYEMVNGPIPKGLHIDHLCRQPLCVRPDHLEPVTCKENLRRGKGTLLTSRLVQQIRERRAAGERTCDIIKDFDNNRQLVDNVIYRKTWKDLP